MKKLLIGFLAFGAFSAQASMLEVNGPLDEKLFEAQVNEEKTYYETLGDLFKTGTLPNFSKISNIAWAGRCFFKKKPNDPHNAGYILRQKISDAGPIALNSYEAFSYWKRHQVPNFFDLMNVEQVFAVMRPTASDVRVKSDSVEISLGGNDKSNLKVSGNYLVEEVSGPVNDVGSVGKVNISARCYYFIPDLNN